MLTLIFAIAAAIALLPGVCAVAGCVLSSRNSRRLEERPSQELQPPMASGF